PTPLRPWPDPGPTPTPARLRPPRRRSKSIRSARRESVRAARLTTAESHSAFLHEAVVFSQQQVLIDLGHRVERDTNHDQQRRSAEPERNIDHVGDEYRQQRNEGEEQRPR